MQKKRRFVFLLILLLLVALPFLCRRFTTPAHAAIQIYCMEPGSARQLVKTVSWDDTETLKAFCVMVDEMSETTQDAADAAAPQPHYQYKMIFLNKTATGEPRAPDVLLIAFDHGRVIGSSDDFQGITIHGAADTLTQDAFLELLK